MQDMYVDIYLRTQERLEDFRNKLEQWAEEEAQDGYFKLWNVLAAFEDQFNVKKKQV